jgi:hypothetical protein
VKKGIIILIALFIILLTMVISSLALVYTDIISLERLPRPLRGIISSIPVIGGRKDGNVPSDPVEVRFLELMVKERALERREQELTEKEVLLTEREKALEEWENNLSAKDMFIDQLTEELQGKIADAKKTAKIFETMRPKDAAEILQKMDDNSLLSIISKVNNQSVADILSNFDPARAAQITMLMSR